MPNQKLDVRAGILRPRRELPRQHCLPTVFAHTVTSTLRLSSSDVSSLSMRDERRTIIAFVTKNPRYLSTAELLQLFLDAFQCLALEYRPSLCELPNQRPADLVRHFSTLDLAKDAACPLAQ
jgi:hypothetical protein